MYLLKPSSSIKALFLLCFVILICPPPQLVQGMLADMYAATAASRAYVAQAAREADAGRASRKDCAAVILYTAENATKARRPLL